MNYKEGDVFYLLKVYPTPVFGVINSPRYTYGIKPYYCGKYYIYEAIFAWRIKRLK